MNIIIYLVIHKEVNNMFDPVTLKLNVDPLILSAIKEDITSEDITTNSVMRKYQLGEVDLICKQDGVIAGLCVFKRVFELLDEKEECPDGEIELISPSGKVEFDCISFSYSPEKKLIDNFAFLQSCKSTILPKNWSNITWCSFQAIVSYHQATIAKFKSFFK